MIRHAGLIAARRDGLWRGVLIEGASGAGKSDLALRCLDAGFRLVADDRVVLWTCQGRLFGRAPDTLAGLIEIRGLDVALVEALPLAEVSLVVREGGGDRLPDPQTVDILGLSISLFESSLRETSLPVKLRRALAHFDGPANRRI